MNFSVQISFSNFLIRFLILSICVLLFRLPSYKTGLGRGGKKQGGGKVEAGKKEGRKIKAGKKDGAK